MKNVKIIVDTNVLMSGLFFGGVPKDIVDLVIDDLFECYASIDILSEYRKTYEKMKNHWFKPDSQISIDSFIANTILIFPSTPIRVCRDEDDNKFIECAETCDADFIITGDKDLLVLQRYKNIEIVTPKEFVDLINNEIS